MIFFLLKIMNNNYSYNIIIKLSISVVELYKISKIIKVM